MAFLYPFTMQEAKWIVMEMTSAGITSFLFYYVLHFLSSRYLVSIQLKSGGETASSEFAPLVQKSAMSSRPVINLIELRINTFSTSSSASSLGA